jgi:hypothetical protein
MPKFLIEIPHDPKNPGCDRTVADFMRASAKELQDAQWGCHDNEHKAWLVLTTKNKEGAEDILPEKYRDRAKIVELTKFLDSDKQEMKAHHKG